MITSSQVKRVSNKSTGTWNRRGVTLMELIVVVGLLVLLLTAISVFVRPMRGLFTMNEQVVSYKEEAKVVFELLEKRLRTTRYLAIYDYIADTYPEEGPANKELQYLFLENGILYEDSDSISKRPYIDPAIFDGNSLELLFSVDQKPGVSVLLVDLKIVDPAGVDVYVATSGFELVNMVLSEARLYDLTDSNKQYPPILVFTEGGDDE